MNVMSGQTVRVVRPQELTGDELAMVQALIWEGGEVAVGRLPEHLKSARLIALIEIDGQLACVGAIKEARSEYISGIARKGGYPLGAQNCVGEFGYVVTKAAFRRRGLATVLSTVLLKACDGPLYATTRDDNPGIQKIIHQSGFSVVGKKWRSSQHPNSSVVLWLRR